MTQNRSVLSLVPFCGLGEQRCQQVTNVSPDGADSIDDIVANRCQDAVPAADPLQIVKWATEALDQVRRIAWNDACQQPRSEPRRGPGRPPGRCSATAGQRAGECPEGARYRLWKNPEDLTENQQTKLRWIAETDPRLYRACLFKEGLRLVVQVPHEAAAKALDRWISWARRCRVPAFVKLQESIVKHGARILAAVEHDL